MLYFLKAHDPHNPLTLQDDKVNVKYTEIQKLEVLERPIMGFKDIKYDIPM